MARHGLKTFSDRVDFLDSSANVPRVIGKVGEFFDRRPADRPYFLWVNFSDPHHVWNAPANPDPASIPLPGHLPDLPGVREDLSKYCGEIQRLDGQVRDVLNAIRQKASLDNTLIVFMGDNGMALPHGKGSLYDPGLNVPLLAQWTVVMKPGQNSDTLISGEDITPTFLDAAGVPILPSMSGRSFAPLLRGGFYQRRTQIFAERGYHGNGPFLPTTEANTFDLSRCVRNGRWKLIYNCTPRQKYMPVDSARDPGWQQMVAAHKEGRLKPEHDRAYFSDPRPVLELYDLQSDPSELNNLAGRAEHSSVEARLKAALQEKMLLDEDYLPLPQ